MTPSKEAFIIKSPDLIDYSVIDQTEAATLPIAPEEPYIELVLSHTTIDSTLTSKDLPIKGFSLLQGDIKNQPLDSTFFLLIEISQYPQYQNFLLRNLIISSPYFTLGEPTAYRRGTISKILLFPIKALESKKPFWSDLTINLPQPEDIYWSLGSSHPIEIDQTEIHIRVDSEKPRVLLEPIFEDNTTVIEDQRFFPKVSLEYSIDATPQGFTKFSNNIFDPYKAIRIRYLLDTTVLTVSDLTSSQETLCWKRWLFPHQVWAEIDETSINIKILSIYVTKTKPPCERIDLPGQPPRYVRTLNTARPIESIEEPKSLVKDSMKVFQLKEVIDKKVGIYGNVVTLYRDLVVQTEAPKPKIIGTTCFPIFRKRTPFRYKIPYDSIEKLKEIGSRKDILTFPILSKAPDPLNLNPWRGVISVIINNQLTSSVEINYREFLDCIYSRRGFSFTTIPRNLTESVNLIYLKISSNYILFPHGKKKDYPLAIAELLVPGISSYNGQPVEIYIRFIPNKDWVEPDKEYLLQVSQLPNFLDPGRIIPDREFK